LILFYLRRSIHVIHSLFHFAGERLLASVHLPQLADLWWLRNTKTGMAE
jgi:hypothetical protein